MSSKSSNGSSTALMAPSNTNTSHSRPTHLHIFGHGSNKDDSSSLYPDVILRVRIISCHNLAVRDDNGSSDPFVDVSLSGTKFSTPVSEHNLDPIYAEKDATFNFPIFKSLARELDALKFVVWDKDKYSKNDYLGEYTLPVDRWFKGTAFAFNDSNNQPLSVNLVSSRPKVTVSGSMRIRLGFAHPPNSTSRSDFGETYKALVNVGIVVLEICNAMDLPEWANGVHIGWDMDPFVKVCIGNEVVGTTSIIRHSRNPVWDKRLFLRVKEHDLSLPMQLVVFDKDTFTPDDYAGEAEINIATFVEKASKEGPKTRLSPDDLPTMHEFKLPLTLVKKSRREYKRSKPTITFRAGYQPYTALRQQLRQRE